MQQTRLKEVLKFPILLGLLACVGCNGATTLTGPGPDRGTARALDTDYDGVTDSIERQLGTDPGNIDSDSDGLTDHYELWGLGGLPVGTAGSLANLPDADGDGVIAALDRQEAGSRLLKSTSALDDERVPVLVPGVDDPPENDLDDDWIPTDFELAGYYYEFDPLTGESWWVKWDGDIERLYAKTDPTKWSTDGDPWSDWEEMTKINLDQRIKIPGDHPCIPAYPEIHVGINNFTIDLKEDVEITSTSGGKTADGWEQSTEHVATTTKDWGIGGGVEVYGTIGTRVGFGVNVKIDGHHEWSSHESEMITANTSGMSAQEWETASVVGTNTLQVARYFLDLSLVNNGTLPAFNPVIFCNLKLGNQIIGEFQVAYEGELKAQTEDAVEIFQPTDGFPSEVKPGGDDMFLSMNQLRSIQSGATFEVEVVHFQAETLVSQFDPDSGRRLFLSQGEWSPYETSIRNVTGRMVIDFKSHPGLRTPRYGGLAAKKVADVRVFGYDNTGNYTGSPPRVTLADGLNWAFGARDNGDDDVTISILDPVSRQLTTTSIYGWTFSLDARILDDILSGLTPVSNFFDTPIRPGNPDEYVYACIAPPPGGYEKPRIYWANLNVDQRKVRAFSLDVRGIREMRFKPNPDYVGEIMQRGVDFNDPESPFFYSFDVPPQYVWTGLEQVIATNSVGNETVLDIGIIGNKLGTEMASGHLLLSFVPDLSIEDDTRGINLEINADAEAFSEPFDVELRHVRTAVGQPLTASLVPAGSASVYDIGTVADIDEIDYSYLRKRPFGETAVDVPLAPPMFPLAAPQWNHAYAVKGRDGSVILLVPELRNLPGVGWYVGGLIWKRYEGV